LSTSGSPASPRPIKSSPISISGVVGVGGIAVAIAVRGIAVAIAIGRIVAIAVGGIVAIAIGRIAIAVIAVAIVRSGKRGSDDSAGGKSHSKTTPTPSPPLHDLHL
jgi:hypothetical protein